MTGRRECVALLKELGLPVEYIVLPTFAYEHKVTSLRLNLLQFYMFCTVRN
jgi:hypothetical protein